MKIQPRNYVIDETVKIPQISKFNVSKLQFLFHLRLWASAFVFVCICVPFIFFGSLQPNKNISLKCFAFDLTYIYNKTVASHPSMPMPFPIEHRERERESEPNLFWILVLFSNLFVLFKSNPKIYVIPRSIYKFISKTHSLTQWHAIQGIFIILVWFCFVLCFI